MTKEERANLLYGLEFRVPGFPRLYDESPETEDSNHKKFAIKTVSTPDEMVSALQAPTPSVLVLNGDLFASAGVTRISSLVVKPLSAGQISRDLSTIGLTPETVQYVEPTYYQEPLDGVSPQALGNDDMNVLGVSTDNVITIGPFEAQESGQSAYAKSIMHGANTTYKKEWLRFVDAENSDAVASGAFSSVDTPNLQVARFGNALLHGEDLKHGTSIPPSFSDVHSLIWLEARWDAMWRNLNADFTDNDNKGLLVIHMAGNELDYDSPCNLSDDDKSAMFTKDENPWLGGLLTTDKNGNFGFKCTSGDLTGVDFCYGVAPTSSAYVIAYPTLQRSMFTPLEDEPSDWGTSYNSYYEKNDSDDYVPVTGDSAPTFVENEYYSIGYNVASTDLETASCIFVAEISNEHQGSSWNDADEIRRVLVLRTNNDNMAALTTALATVHCSVDGHVLFPQKVEVALYCITDGDERYIGKNYNDTKVDGFGESDLGIPYTNWLGVKSTLKPVINEGSPLKVTWNFESGMVFDIDELTFQPTVYYRNEIVSRGNLNWRSFKIKFKKDSLHVSGGISIKSSHTSSSDWADHYYLGYQTRQRTLTPSSTIKLHTVSATLFPGFPKHVEFSDLALSDISKNDNAVKRFRSLMHDITVVGGASYVYFGALSLDDFITVAKNENADAGGKVLANAVADGTVLSFSNPKASVVFKTFDGSKSSVPRMPQESLDAIEARFNQYFELNPDGAAVTVGIEPLIASLGLSEYVAIVPYKGSFQNVVEPSVTSATEMGTYHVRLALKDTDAMLWPDGSEDTKAFEWTIGKIVLEALSFKTGGVDRFTGLEDTRNYSLGTYRRFPMTTAYAHDSPLGPQVDSVVGHLNVGWKGYVYSGDMNTGHAKSSSESLSTDVVRIVIKKSSLTTANPYTGVLASLGNYSTTLTTFYVHFEIKEEYRDRYRFSSGANTLVAVFYINVAKFQGEKQWHDASDAAITPPSGTACDLGLYWKLPGESDSDLREYTVPSDNGSVHLTTTLNGTKDGTPTSKEWGVAYEHAGWAAAFAAIPEYTVVTENDSEVMKKIEYAVREIGPTPGFSATYQDSESTTYVINKQTNA